MRNEATESATQHPASMSKGELPEADHARETLQRFNLSAQDAFTALLDQWRKEAGEDMAEKAHLHATADDWEWEQALHARAERQRACADQLAALLVSIHEQQKGKTLETRVDEGDRG